MDNQTQPNIPPFQSQTQTPVSPSINWAKLLLFILSGLVIVTGSVFIGIQIGKNQITNSPSTIKKLTTPPIQLETTPTPIPEPSPISCRCLDGNKCPKNDVGLCPESETIRCSIRPGSPKKDCPIGYQCECTCCPPPGLVGCAQYDVCIKKPSPTQLPIQ